ncbi:MAG: hypothetical protein N2C14_02545 [Planctomycetales bacterium]
MNESVEAMVRKQTRRQSLLRGVAFTLFGWSARTQAGGSLKFTAIMG